jgi:hypothetical protein
VAILIGEAEVLGMNKLKSSVAAEVKAKPQRIMSGGWKEGVI